MSVRFDLSGLDPAELGQLMKMLAGTDVEECEIEQGEYSVLLRRHGVPMPRATRVESAPQRQEPDPDEPRVVQSPAVGVFYRAESRGARPSAEAGTRVQVGDVLGSIEVMGVPHAVPSTHDGVIEDFLVEDGEPVEYGQPIAAIGDA